MKSLRNNNWINDNTRRKISDIFEPKYGRKLTKFEIDTIANSLVVFTEKMLEYSWNQQSRRSF